MTVESKNNEISIEQNYSGAKSALLKFVTSLFYAEVGLLTEINYISRDKNMTTNL